MGEDTGRIEQEIRAQRDRLGRNLDTLESEAKALTDWREQYRRHTGTALTVAFGGGVVLGLLAARQREDGPAVERPQSTSGLGFSRLNVLGENTRARRQVDEKWDQILEALIGVAAAAAADWIGRVVPGFRDQYQYQSQYQNRSRDAVR